MSIIPRKKNHLVLHLLPCALALALQSGCAVGPDFVPPTASAPENWTSWRSSDDSLKMPVLSEKMPANWWEIFGDPILDRIQSHALESSPDIHTAALRYAQARTQRIGIEALSSPAVNLTGGVIRQRQSEYGAGTRLIDALGGSREKLASSLAEPFTLYQAGFDASWELDLWGRVQRSLEAVDADITRQAEYLRMARLALISEVARNYFELRMVQRKIALAREDMTALEERTALVNAKSSGGLIGQLENEQQHAELEEVKARLPTLLAEEGDKIGRIALLLGEPPGQLVSLLRPKVDSAEVSLPDLSLGLPSEVALHRPDIRAAEARLRAATANTGVAEADLYPSIRLGTKFGYESYLSGEFAGWGSRAWSIGPSINLPIFDRGRRKSVVHLRELEQKEAAVSYQKTVLQAWKEIDDALNRYAAEQKKVVGLKAREDRARRAWQLSQARYASGLTDYVAVIDSQRYYAQARRELVESEGVLQICFVATQKAIGNAP
ncbi:efflux transporter outer membrane subunit [Herbaspirillum robiniae]|uniref:efflux transporter outer membrane subunit n=1 Tax=Herbaspirillum robiniae TaxID=2014887 RepID=UPI003D7739CF